MVVHWDGKILPDLTGREKVDRIAVLVSYGGSAKFLTAPKISGSATGQQIAEAVYNVLVEWNITEKVVASCFDTTSTNTGLKNSACYYLDQLLGKQLIQLGCRHHIHEIALKNVYEKKFGKTSAPETLLFNRFANEWEKIKHKQFTSGLDDPIVRSSISNDECEQIKHYCIEKLKHKQIRADYKEFLELTVLFLGGDESLNQISFQTCGATSHARFMSKCIYGLKMFLFRSHFTLTSRELKSMREFLIFVVKIYLKAWYNCPNGIISANQDLNFMRICKN